MLKRERAEDNAYVGSFPILTRALLRLERTMNSFCHKREGGGGQGRGGEGRGGEGDLIKMKTHTLDKTFSFHDIKNILEFLDKSSRVMHKNISKQIINKQ